MVTEVGVMDFSSLFSKEYPMLQYPTEMNQDVADANSGECVGGAQGIVVIRQE